MIVRELKRVRSFNLNEDESLPNGTIVHRAISDLCSDAISESEDGTESDNTLGSSEEEEDDMIEQNTGMQIK